MSTTLDHMPAKTPKNDRHKPRRMVGVPERVCVALEAMGREREASLAEMVKNACLFYLEQNGRWPPSRKP
jgi:hypothetical protein